MNNPSSLPDPSPTKLKEDQIIRLALNIVKKRLVNKGSLTSPRDVELFLSLKLGQETQEIFYCIYLDNKNQIIEFEELFKGTIDQVSVYPRIVVKRCLEVNASALILAHNHPSSVCEPSSADQSITQRLKEALALIDVRVLDHLIIGGTNCVSLAERGYL